MAIVLGLQVAGLAVFAGITAPWQVLPFLALFSPGYGGVYPLRPSLQGEYFGRSSFGGIQGIVLGVNAFAAVLGPIFCGWMFDTLGNYRLALWVITAVVAFSVPLALALPRPPIPQPLPEPVAAPAV
jgi:MFS family permease